MKIPLEKIKKIPNSALLKIINRAKKFLKKDQNLQRICDEYKINIDCIDNIPIRFGDIDVSAKTDHGIITLSYRLLCDGDFFKDYSYLIHEITHYFQQCLNDHPTQGANDGMYLDNPDEQEGFKNQIKYISDMFGDKEADKYVNHLLNHHNITNEKERDDKKQELMELL